MRQIKISNYHRGCWGTGSTEKVHGVKLIHASPNVVTKKKGGKIYGRAFWKVIAPTPEVLEKYLKVLENETSVVKLEIFQKVAARAFVFIEYEILYSPYEVAIEKGFVPIAPAEIENGIEMYTLVAPNQKALKEFMSIIDKDEDIKILSIGKVHKAGPMYHLTEKQKEALQTAVLYDYYNWPRTITLEELASAAGLSRKVFQEHLRKAEAKLFPALAKEALVS